MLTVAGKNFMLDNWGGDFLSAHSAFPGDSGASEIAYHTAGTRATGTFGAASAGSRALTATASLNIPAAATVKWLGRWSAVSAGTCREVKPNGGDDKEFYVDTTANTINIPAHGYANDQTIVFYGGQTPSTLITEGTTYYVVTTATNTFQVSATLGGGAIDIDRNAGASCVVSKITEQTFAANGILDINTFVRNLNG